MENEKEKVRCEKCGSLLTYFRVKTVDRLCRKCGHIQKLEVKKDGVAD